MASNFSISSVEKAAAPASKTPDNPSKQANEKKYIDFMVVLF